MAFLLNGVTIDSLSTAIWGAVIIGLLNALLWPLLSFVLVPFAVLTLGIGALLLNACFVLRAAEFSMASIPQRSQEQRPADIG